MAKEDYWMLDLKKYHEEISLSRSKSNGCYYFIRYLLRKHRGIAEAHLRTTTVLEVSRIYVGDAAAQRGTITYPRVVDWLKSNGLGFSQTRTPKTEHAIAKGDVVMFRAGGPKMLVDHLWEEEGTGPMTLCWWFHEGTLHKDDFDVDKLQKVQAS